MSDVPDERRKKSKQDIKKKQASDKKKQEASVNLINDVNSFINEKSKEIGVPVGDIVNEILSNNFAVIEFDETTGKASLVYNWQPSATGAVGEKEPTPEAIIKEYRDLRENFAPVSAGVEWHRDFTSGGGFVIHVDDIKDDHKNKMADEIKKFAGEVYQDDFVIGLDAILDIMIDIAITDGCDAAEICYQNDVDIANYFDKWEQVDVIINGQKKTVNVPVFKEPKWEEELKSIVRLKVIEDTYTRLRPYRHPLSGEVLYFTLDEKVDKEDPMKQFENLNKREVIKFLPWEIFWLTWNPRGTNMKGMSQIKSVYTVAKFVKAIQTAVGVGFNRWANKKYFFVCGTDKKPWSKKHFQEFMKSMEKMLKNNWVGIPVPAGFEVKEIGGEKSIFEGKDLLDFLTGMICAGMQYPRDFLESGKTQASDKSWLAWTVRYGRSQQIIKRYIEHQLFKRHLWCKFGKTHKLSKKGKKVEEQENVPNYIPRLMWKAEGQWLKDAKIKSLSQILNVASPVDTVLKLGVEIELAQTVGIGDLDWNPIIEYYNTQTQQKLVDAKRSLITAKEQLKLDEEMQKSGKIKELLKTKFETSLERAKEPPQEEPTTPEAKLQQQTEKRGEGGVSKTLRDKDTKKGQSKPMGSERQPTLRTQETSEPQPPIIVMDTDIEAIKDIVDNAVKGLEDKLKIDGKGKGKEAKIVQETPLGLLSPEESKRVADEMAATEKLKQQKLEEEIKGIKEKQKLVEELKEGLNTRKTVTKRSKDKQ